MSNSHSIELETVQPQPEVDMVDDIDIDSFIELLNEDLGAMETHYSHIFDTELSH